MSASVHLDDCFDVLRTGSCQERPNRHLLHVQMPPHAPHGIRTGLQCCPWSLKPPDMLPPPRWCCNRILLSAPAATHAAAWCDVWPAAAAACGTPQPAGQPCLPSASQGCFMISQKYRHRAGDGCVQISSPAEDGGHRQRRHTGVVQAMAQREEMLQRRTSRETSAAGPARPRHCSCVRSPMMPPIANARADGSDCQKSRNGSYKSSFKTIVAEPCEQSC